MMDNQPLAIVSMACRFPKLDGIDELWDALCSRFVAADTVPMDRWDADRYFSDNELSKGKTWTRRGGFVNQDVRTFDASFFGISPREAENMDPQQRLILEVVWEAFENSGFVLPDYAGKNVGVYVGGFMLDHMITSMSLGNRSSINQHTAAGMMMTMLSNRVSHTFDFRGPSLSIDTACSSSLVAFHYACQDVWRGACELAVVGGTNVMMRPEYPMGMAKGHFISRDGESKSFDQRGDGYGRGEGAGVVLLKPLDKALEDGDKILSLVKGTGTNQDGRTPGISMPNGDSQQALIEEVCEKHNIDPASVDYVECHGTGTGIGDPTECNAIGAVYGKNRGDNPVVIGSIKSNIGHTEAVAGIAGVIKATLNVMHRTATPLGNLQTPREDIEFGELGIRLSDDMIPLGRKGQPVTAAINSFGYGGSNAHVLLQSAPETAIENKNASDIDADIERPEFDMPYVLPVSGRSKAAMVANAEALALWVKSSDASLADIIYTASQRRSHHNHRSVAMGRTRSQLIESLEAIANEQESELAVQDSQPIQGLRKPVYVFTGMGPQWWYMGQELYKNQPVYREYADRADKAFEKVAGFSILAEMLKSEDDSDIQKTIFAQPANLVVQIGVYEMLKAKGMVPGLVVGHSVGELGSAYAAGVLSLEDAMTVSFHRSTLQSETAGLGGMLAVGIGKEEAAERIADYSEDLVSFAAINGPSSITLAGCIKTLEKIAEELTAEGVFAKALEVEIPYHSPMMEPLMGRLKEALKDVKTNVPQLPLYSTVTGALVTEASFGADYWPLNIRQPVEFEAAIMAILEEGYNTFVEVGPHPVLSASLRDCIKVAGKDCRLIHTLRRNLPNETRNVQRAAMSVFASGCDIDWTHFTDTGSFVQLPNYKWQRERYWNENDRAAQDRINPLVNPILGTQEALGSAVWRNDFDHNTVKYLRDHVVSTLPILPAAGYIESLLEVAALQFPDAAGLVIRDLEIIAPLILSAETGSDFTTTYDPRNNSAIIRSQQNGQLGVAQIHVTARVGEIRQVQPAKLDMGEFKADNTKSDNVTDFYADLDKNGLSYGPLFQTVRELYARQDEGTVVARLELDPSLKGDLHKYKLHPTMLDGCFQTLMALLKKGGATYLPTDIGELCCYVDTAPENLWCIGRLVSKTERVLICEMSLVDDEGNVIAVIRDFRATAAGKPELTDKWGDKVRLQVLNTEWDHGETLDEPKRLGHWITIGDGGETADYVTQRMSSFGASVVNKVTYGDELSLSGTESTVRFDSVDDAKAVVESVGDLNGVVIYAGIDENLLDESPTAETSLNAMVTITQALGEIAVEKRPRVYVVTQNAYSVDEDDAEVNPKSSAINGFTRVAANELEGFRFSSIDLPDELDDEEMLDAFTFELLCDAEENEVAIRGDSRMVSELLENTRLTDDVVVPTLLDDDHPVKVRPLRPDAESVGMVRVLATPIEAVADNEIKIRVETSLVPFGLILDQSSNHIDQPFIEIVGRVAEAGSAVTDLQVGSRVCGLAPADLASHMSGDRSAFHVVTVPDDADAAQLVGGITSPACARRAAQVVELESGDSAVVFESAMGLEVAKVLTQAGVDVIVVSNNPDEVDTAIKEAYPVYLACPESIDRAMVDHTDGKKFSGLVVPLEEWSKYFDFRALVDGGWVIDTDDRVAKVQLPPHVGLVSRTALSAVLNRPAKFEKILQDVVAGVIDQSIEGAPTVDVSLADIAWQNLPFADTNARIAIDYTGDRDLPVVQSDELQFRDDASYLITGGFGGFGYKTAQWLVENGARHLVLTGRTGASTPASKEIVANLEAMGASVAAVACDSSDFDAVSSMFDMIASDLPPLKGVYHCGAVIIDEAIFDINLDTFNLVMRSKATGAWNLHNVTKDMELDHFVLYSSIANSVGNGRQSAYSAANGFLVGLAEMRAAQGLPATAVNWGAIADVGVVAQDETLEMFLKAVGIRSLDPDMGLDMLSNALVRNTSAFGLMLIKSWADWARFEAIGSSAPRFRTLVESDTDQKDSGIRDQLVAELTPLNAGDRADLMAQLIQQIVASVLKADSESIEVDRPINELGIDSLMATEIQALFESNLGLSISVLELIGDTTIRSLAKSSLESLEDELQKGPKVDVAESEAEEEDQIIDDEVDLDLADEQDESQVA